MNPNRQKISIATHVMLKNSSQPHFHKQYDSMRGLFRVTLSRNQKINQVPVTRNYQCRSPEKQKRYKFQDNQDLHLNDQSQIIDFSTPKISPQTLSLKLTSDEQSHKIQAMKALEASFKPIIIKDFEETIIDKSNVPQKQSHNLMIKKGQILVQQKLIFRTKMLKIIHRNRQKFSQMNKGRQKQDEGVVRNESNKKKIYDAIGYRMNDEPQSNPQAQYFNTLLSKLQHQGRREEHLLMVNDFMVQQQPGEMVNKYQSKSIYQEIRKEFKPDLDMKNSNENKIKIFINGGVKSINDPSTIFNLNLKDYQSFNIKSQKIMLKPLKQKSKSNITKKIKLNRYPKEQRIQGW